jgi:hypothetical protein
MSNYEFAGRADVEKALDMLVNLDRVQSNAIVVLEIDQEIERLQKVLEQYDRDPAYVPDADTVEVISGYVERADDWNRPA